MSWAKRNLYFLILVVLAVVLLGAASWYCFSEWRRNNANWETLNSAYQDMRELAKDNPSKEKIDAMRQQINAMNGIGAKMGKAFAPIPSIPNTPHVTDPALAGALGSTINQLRRSAAENNVALPPDFTFSFTAERDKAGFAPRSTEPLARQLGEVKAICEVLFDARIASLESLQRERVSPDDVGAQGDYLDKQSITNNNAVLTPYQVTFRSFTPELGDVLAGFANEPHGIIVNTISVEPSDAVAADAAAQPTPVAPMGVRGALPVAADEKKLKITLLLEIVKIQPGPSR